MQTSQNGSINEQTKIGLDNVTSQVGSLTPPTDFRM